MFSRYRMVNPLLGVYYGIFTSAFIGLGVLLLILEYMGHIDRQIVYALTFVAFFLTAVIALASTTNLMDEFYVSGRRVPSGLNGLIIFVLAVGGAGFSGLIGLTFFWGLAAYGLLLGLLGGVVLAGLLFSGFIRKAGVYSLPSFFEMRFHSRFSGVIVALFILLPSFCFALAELSLIKMLAPYVLGISFEFCLLLVMFFLLVFLLPGGMRSGSWVQCALALVLVLGILVPLTLVSLKYTNLPLAQFTFGSLIDDVAAFQNTVSGAVDTRSIPDLPLILTGTEPVIMPFLSEGHGFGIIETFSMFFFMIAGVAAMPSLLLRSAVTSNVIQARKSFAWGAALIGFLILSVPAYAVFMRYLIFNPDMKVALSSLPSWIDILQTMGLVELSDIDGDGQILARELEFKRDAVFLALPIVSNFKQTLQSLTFSALLAAAMAGLLARVITISHVLARDFHNSMSSIEADVTGGKGMRAVRFGFVLVVILLFGLVFGLEFDPFQMFLAGILFCGIGLFPILLLSIWWQGMTKTGVFLGLLFGLMLSGWILYSSNFGSQAVLASFSLFSMASLAVLVVFIISIVASKIGPAPSTRELETLMDIRVPGGEALYDRRLRLAMPRRSLGNN